jgi:hypothetical protein
LPDFSWYNIPKRGKIPNDHELNQTAIKYFQFPNRPNGHKIYQHFPLQDPPKFTQIGNFWFENKHHLASLVKREKGDCREGVPKIFRSQDVVQKK